MICRCMCLSWWQQGDSCRWGRWPGAAAVAAAEEPENCITMSMYLTQKLFKKVDSKHVL
jgi:hypothetical protein